MFFPSFLLGALGGVLGAKLVTRRHFRNCDRGGFRGRGFRGPRIFFIAHELGLDRRQKGELWSLARELKHAFGDVRFGGLEGIDSLVDAVTGDSFDRASVEAAAQKHSDAVTGLKEKIVRAAERVHGILTPEQRQRLRQLIGGQPVPGGPDGGPYRTAL